MEESLVAARRAALAGHSTSVVERNRLSRGRGWRRAGAVVALAIVALLAGCATASAKPVSRTYELTLEGSGSGAFDYTESGPEVNDTGSMSATYKLVYDIVVTVDTEAETVDVEPLNPPPYGHVTPAKSLTGHATFSSHRSCVGPPCSGPDTICTYSNVEIGQHYVGPQNIFLEDRWGYGPDHATYVSGNVVIDQMEGGVPPEGSTAIPCSGTATVVYPEAHKMPGLLGTLEFPLAQVGQKHFVVLNGFGPAVASNYYGEPTAEWSYTLTFDEINPNVHFATATLDFGGRLKRRAARLRSQVQPLADRKAALEKDIVAQGDAAREAAAGVRKLAKKLHNIDKAIGDVQASLKDLQRRQGHEDPRLQGLLVAEAHYANDVADLEQKVLDAQTHGKDPDKGVERKLALARKQLAAVEAVLKPKLRQTEFGTLRADWLDRLGKLQSLSFDLQSAEAKLFAKEGAAEQKLTADAGDLRAVDEKLLEIGERLAGFDPEVDAVEASAGGQPVFRAVAPYRYAQLAGLNREIDAQQKMVERIQAGKEHAFAEFRDAEKESIAAGHYLAKVMHAKAWADYAVQLAFDTWDVAEATAKGGIVGAVAELGKKLIERALKETAPPAGNGIEPGSIEAEVNKEFQAGLKDSFSAPQLGRLAVERGVKEFVTKPLRDNANQAIGSLVFEKVEMPFRTALEVGPRIVSGGEANFLRAEKAIERLRGQLKNLRKGYVSPLAGKGAAGKFFEGLGKSIAKDALKTLIKGNLERVETLAWIDYFTKESIARSFYAPYHAYADLWEKALVRLDELIAKKMELLAGRKDGELKTEMSVPFAWQEASTIRLSLGARDPEEPVEVLVNGVRATQLGGGDEYVLPGGTAVPGPEGTLAIVLR